jgi:hypothetical protein
MILLQIASSGALIGLGSPLFPTFPTSLLGYFIFSTGGGQKPGSVIGRTSWFAAYFFTAGAIAEAFPINTNTRLSAGKCFCITCRATSGVTASTRASS